MDAKVVGHTIINQAALVASDLDTLNQVQTPDAEKLIEYAARVCYHSTDKMGHAPDFIKARVGEGHVDVIEHAWVTLALYGAFDFKNMHTYNRYLELDWVDGWYASGNLRAWSDFLKEYQHHPLAHEVMTRELARVAPAIFGQQESSAPLYSSGGCMAKPETDGTRSVALVAHTMLLQELGNHNAASFLIEGISLTASHQLVRHRLLSFSQRSFRYTDIEKGDVQMTIPDAIKNNVEAHVMIRLHYITSVRLYRQMRELGIRREDARFLLPQAIQTRLVVSGNFPAWQHFLKLRLDKAAQWEIRYVANMIQTQLNQLDAETFDGEY